MNGPEEAAVGLTDWGARLARDASRFQRLQVEIAAIRVVESSSDGAIRVTVDATGAVLDIATAGRITSLRPQEVGGRIMAIVVRAQGRLAERVRQAAHATLGPDAPAAASIWQQLQARFGEPPPEQRPPGRQPPRRGPAVAPAPRPGVAPEPSLHHRPPRSADDEVWADEPILRPATEKRRDWS